MELVRVGLIPLREEEKIMYFYFQEEKKEKKNTHSLSSTGVNPAKPIRYTLTLFDLITKLGIILVNVKREQGRVDRRIRIEHLERKVQTDVCRKKSLRTSTSTRLALLS